MDTREKIRNIFLYLLSIKNMDKNIIRDVYKYRRIIWEAEIYKRTGCILNKKENEEWLQVGKECGELYNSLFEIYSDLEKNSEDLEIVWGHGLLSWQIKDEKIFHPIFTTKMSLSFNAKNAVFTLSPYNNITNLEVGILDGLDLPNLHKVLDVSLELKDSGINVCNIEDVEDILIKLLNCLSSESELNNLNKEWISSTSIEITNKPVFYNTPCIILRNIDTKLWDSELNSILSYLDEGKPIPKTIEALVNEVITLDNTDIHREWECIGKDILFPLPANEEQEEITRKLSQNFGVVVQGPPGTGKSHTIANLISHLIAHGKRVLVTSQTDKALKVLSDKIPEEIRSLCISLLGNDAKALKDLDESVRKITENLSLNPNSLLNEMAPLEEELKMCRQDINNLLNDLKQAEALENKTINYKNEILTLSQLAKWIHENKDTYSWIEDDIHINTKCPLSSSEFSSLIKLINENKKDDIDKINSIGDLLHKLPTYDELISKLDRLKSIEDSLGEYKKNIELWHISIEEDQLNKLLKLVKNTRDKINFIENSWLKSIMKSYYSIESSKDFWKDALLNLNNYIRQINVLKQIVNAHNIKFSGNVDINKIQMDFQVLKKHIESKGKVSSMFKLFHSEQNYILENYQVDYRPINTKEQCDIFSKVLEKVQLERSIRTFWNNTVKEYGGKLVTNSDNNFLNIISESVLDIEAITRWEDEFINPIMDLLDTIKIPKELNLCKLDSIDFLMKGLQSLKYIKEYEKLNKYVDNIRKQFLKNNYLSVVSDWIVDYDEAKIRKLYDELWKLNDLKVQSEQINNYFRKLKESCPLLSERLLLEWHNNTLLDTYKNWNEAWKWKVGTSLLNELYKQKPEQIEQDIEAERLREKTLIKEIVAKKTWYNQIMRTTESQKRSLFTWLESIKRIGKGTGKQAAKYRKIAQKEMENCKEVIPAWIMPLNKIIENIKIGQDLFDVVIVDESSQSDISSITALLRGKRAVIVGDECQIGPEAIGKDNEMVENLINRYLRDIPHKEWFDLKTSLYHTALRVFPSRLVLKEHFRCVPDIINFSNNLCYSGEIIPLRCPKAHESFTPAICALKVAGIKDNSKNKNEVEAAALVDKITECCNDEKYKGMTMGVISLLGEAQSELIESMLKEKIGIEEMIKRKIICGDAYSFQGDERDVMFLSLVIAKNAKFTALTRESDIRRFNVAASRARNQMFLFHSVDLDDLNPKCVRSELLNYCIDFHKKYALVSSNESILTSGFKKDVFNLIKSKGYAVRSDVRIGKYKIDFVIECLNGRLAVDCCGESTYYYPNWEEVHNRRLILQRAGWKFFILRESQFYYKPLETMEELYKQLDNMRIMPVINSIGGFAETEAALTDQ